MSYYLLPRINCNITDANIKIKFGGNDEDTFINKSLALYLNNVKEEITKYIADWDDVKKKQILLNTYTQIYPIINFL